MNRAPASLVTLALLCLAGVKSEYYGLDGDSQGSLQADAEDKADCHTMPIAECTDHPHCIQCIDSISRKNFCLTRREAEEIKKQRGPQACFDEPPGPKGSCTGQMQSYCKPPECIWCATMFPGGSICVTKDLASKMPHGLYKCEGANSDGANLDGIAAAGA